MKKTLTLSKKPEKKKKNSTEKVPNAYIIETHS